MLDHSWVPRIRTLWSAVFAAALAAILLIGHPAAPVAAETPRAYTIAVMVSHNKPPDEGPEEVDAIRDFVTQRVAMINAAGGILGRQLEAKFFDDLSSVETTVANVEAALADPNLIAMIGIWNSSRGSKVIDRIGASGVPLISEISVETLFANFPNVYTLTRSVRDEQDVFQSYARDRYKRIAFVGAADDLYTQAYHTSIVAPGGPLELVQTFWLDGTVETQLDAVDRAIADIKAASPDLIFLSIGSKRGSAFLARLTAAGVGLPVFIALGSVNGVIADPAGRAYGGPIYEIAEGGIANLNNERLEQLLRQPSRLADRTYSSYAVGYGARYADLVALVAEQANAGGDADVTAVRARVVQSLSQLSEGRRVWRGWAQDWSFTKERASSERSLIVWRPAGQASSILAPAQFLRTAAGIVPVPVLYVHLHMVRVFRVDSADKSFEAEFFFTMRSDADVPVSAIEFTNAYRGPGNGQPLISIREVHEDPAQGDTARARVFKISGKFTFEPELRKYPFDEQIFSISFQPSRTSQPFLLQPPAEQVRRQPFSVDGWSVKSHYVGTNELIIHSIEGALSEERIIPYYNFNYTWVMERQVIDYVLRVLVPLSCIMIVAYIAIFIPRSEFEAIIAIQVTALLSAIALYLALNQPSADDATTLSDKIFVVAYATISVMIALSIFEVNTTVIRWPGLVAAINLAQVYLVPIVALGMITYVLFTASSDLTLGRALLQAWSGKGGG